MHEKLIHDLRFELSEHLDALKETLDNVFTNEVNTFYFYDKIKLMKNK
jgi:hypothetical protein